MLKIILSTVCLAVILSGCTVKSEQSATAFMMDTVVNIKAVADKGVLDDALNTARDYEALFSHTDKNSEISRLNEIGTLNVSDETAYILTEALKYCEITNGKFDISLGEVTDLWDFENKIIPDDTALKRAVQKSGYTKITVDGNTVNTGGTKINLGAVAKGYIADKVRDRLLANGVSSGVLNFGGNVVVFGDDYSVVGIKNPNGDSVLAKLKVKNTSVVTSGTYERAFIRDNKNYHHILNSKTGYPADTDLLSATVICSDGTKADIMSTCCLLLGLQDGLEFINSQTDVEAIFVTLDGEIFTSSGIYSDNGYYLL